MYFLHRIDWVLHLLTLVSCAYFSAMGISHYIESVLETSSVAAVETKQYLRPETALMNPRAKEFEAYQVVVDRNIFSSKDLKASENNPAEVASGQAGELAEAVKTALDIRLKGTMKFRDGRGRRSSAIIAQGKSALGKVYFVGDEGSFAPNVKLVKVGRKRIEFVNGGRLEFAELEGAVAKSNVFASSEEVFGALSLASKDKTTPAVSATASAATIVINQQDVDKALSNLDSLQKEVRIAPNFVNGRIDGFRVLSIRPGGLISKLGVRRGDVLEKVNGQALDIQKGLELFNNLKDSKNFSLEVIRGGKPETLEYEIR